MVRHNNVIPFQHFHKKWQTRVKTWLQQPIQKKIRRDRRKEKAAKLAPRPVSGALRPLVHAPTQKYNSKVRLGRGFTLEELKEAGINKHFAQTVGIAVDHRRTNKSNESLALNVQRLKDYQARLIVFPKKKDEFKKGDSSKAEVDEAQQLKVAIFPKPTVTDAVTFTQITEELKSFKAYAALRQARSDAKLVGIRLKKSKEAKDAAPAKEKADE